MNNLSKLILRVTSRRSFSFSTSKSSNGIFDTLKEAWNKTFPSGEDEFRQKYQKISEAKKMSQKEL